MATPQELRAKLLAQRAAQKEVLRLKEELHQDAVRATRNMIKLGYNFDDIADMAKNKVSTQHLGLIFKTIKCFRKRKSKAEREREVFGASRWLEKPRNFTIELSSDDEYEDMVGSRAKNDLGVSNQAASDSKVDKPVMGDPVVNKAAVNVLEESVNESVNALDPSKSVASYDHPSSRAEYRPSDAVMAEGENIEEDPMENMMEDSVVRMEQAEDADLLPANIHGHGTTDLAPSNMESVSLNEPSVNAPALNAPAFNASALNSPSPNVLHTSPEPNAPEPNAPAPNAHAFNSSAPNASSPNAPSLNALNASSSFNTSVEPPSPGTLSPAPSASTSSLNAPLLKASSTAVPSPNEPLHASSLHASTSESSKVPSVDAPSPSASSPSELPNGSSAPSDVPELMELGAKPVDISETQVTQEIEKVKSMIREMQQKKLAREVHKEAEMELNRRSMELRDIAVKRALLDQTREQRMVAVSSLTNKVARLEKSLAVERSNLNQAKQELAGIGMQKADLEVQETRLREELSRPRITVPPKQFPSTTDDKAHTVAPSQESAGPAKSGVKPNILTVADSPLRMFSSFRMCPNYGPKLWFSNSFNGRFVKDLHRRTLCPTELKAQNTQCKNPTCSHVHFSEFEIDPKQVCQYMATRKIGDKEFMTGLHDTIVSRLKEKNVPPAQIAAVIIGCNKMYRPNQILDWDSWDIEYEL